MEVRTPLGYVSVVRRPSGWWDVRRAPFRSSSPSLLKALRSVGLTRDAARAIARHVGAERAYVEAG